jgi:hypothetical protein
VVTESQRQWYSGSGWATGSETWMVLGGIELVAMQTERQHQYDVQCATFYANFRHTQRVHHAHQKKVKKSMAREWQTLRKLYDANMDSFKRERIEVQAFNDRISHLERKRVEMRDRATARALHMKECDAATTAERANISRGLCARLQRRPESSSAASVAVDECVLCLDAQCTHIARACLHVIGCASCCSTLTLCPICRTPTTFGVIIYP